MFNLEGGIMSYYNDSDSSYVSIRKIDGRTKISRVENAARGIEAASNSSADVAKAAFHEISNCSDASARTDIITAYKRFLDSHTEEIKEGFETIRQA